jgi:hypothetical protein
MRRLASFSLVLATCSLALAGDALAQNAPPPWIPGLPVPVFLPPNFPWATTQGQAPPSPTTTAQPPIAQQPPPALPPGAADANGFLTVGFMQTEATQMLRDLVANLPADRKQRVNGIPMEFDTQTSDVNAFAGCANGKAFMAVTLPLARAAGHIAEAKAADEFFGTSHVDAYTQLAADSIGRNGPVPDPPPGFYSPAEANDPRKLARERVVFDEEVGFILGHELAHHYLGHTGCANGDVAGVLDPATLGRIASQIVPAFNQPNEIAADVNGTQNLLDVGATRQGGLTEMGGVLTLQFFGKLQTLDPGAVALAILQTHPFPQLRVPLVQSTAQTWRATHAAGGGAAPATFPFPFPFPWPLPH